MMSLQLLGMKHTGKSSLGRLWAARNGWDFYDLDALLEAEAGGGRTSRQLYQEEGKDGFQRWEAAAARRVSGRLALGRVVLAWGGGTVTNKLAVDELCPHGAMIVLNERIDLLYERIMRGGKPAFLSDEHPWEDFQKLYRERSVLYEALSPWHLDLEGASLETAFDRLNELWNTIPGSGNS